MTTQEPGMFEKNIMSKLVKEYKENGNKNVPFDLQKIRNLGRDGGFATQAWDEIDLQDKVNELVTKGLIEDLTGGRYQISDLGIQRYVM